MLGRISAWLNRGAYREGKKDAYILVQRWLGLESTPPPPPAPPPWIDPSD